MDVESTTLSEIQRLAEKYQCDPRDPTFAVLEKVIQIREDLRHSTRTTLLGAENIRSQVALDLDAKNGELKQTLGILKMELNRAEELTLKSAQNLIASRKINAREKLLAAIQGGLIPTALLIGAIVWYTLFSPMARLGQAGIVFQLNFLKSGSSSLSLRGPKIINSQRGEDKVLLEFSGTNPEK